MSKCWYCNNELTTGDNPKHFGICNKCYDEMFKSGDTIICSLTNKIAELQYQLEASEIQKRRHFEKVKILDKENKELKELLEEVQAQYEYECECNKQFVDCQRENVQLKKSQKELAIIELEKLREYIVLNDEYDEEIGCNIIKTFDLIEGLADKIKSLKGEKR